MKRMSLFLILFFSGLAAAKQDHCEADLRPANGVVEAFISGLERWPQTQDVVKRLHDFAIQHNLAEKMIEVGPAQRRVKRLMVALDPADKKLLGEYLNEFNFNTPLGARTPGLLSFEFSFEEQVEHHIESMVRTSGNANDQIYLYGRPDLTFETHLVNFTKYDYPIHGYAHLFALKADERTNVREYLSKPELRAPSDPGRSNCISWSCGIELGKSSPQASDEDRRFLFGELGMSRTIAPFEISRRWMHAASQRHGAVVVYVNGQKGLEAFKADSVTALHPKIPFESVIRNLPLANNHPALKAVTKLPDGARIFFPIAAGASPTAFHALVQNSEHMATGYHTFLLVNGISETVLTRALSAPAKMKVTSFFLGGNLRRLYRQGKIDVVPDYLSQFTRRLRDPNFHGYDFDAMVVRVSPPDEQGRYSLGPNHDMIMTILKYRPHIKIIAEINGNVPRTRGTNFLTAAQFFATFEDSTELAGPSNLPVTAVEENIGANLATLIPDESTLQIGIGNVFDGLPGAMKKLGRKHLRITTEMFGDAMMKLVMDKVVDQAETGFAYGTKGLYQWLNNNQDIEFLETEVINSPLRIAGIPNFHAVNTALQVNLRGDANATHGADDQRISSPGGQVDFMFGASHSSGDAKSIIALRSTAKYGTVSTITLDLYGANTTTSHELVSHVVTEYGVAELRGRSEHDRAIALINIAHPNFRAGLFSGAVSRGLLRSEDQKSVRLDRTVLEH